MKSISVSCHRYEGEVAVRIRVLFISLGVYFVTTRTEYFVIACLCAQSYLTLCDSVDCSQVSPGG